MKKKERLKSAEINKASAILKKGGVIIFPTDTVYGIGCIFNNVKAISRIRKIKNSDQYFPILISSAKQVKKIAYINPKAASLMKKYWPGALTLILAAKDGSKIGFRMPDSPLVLKLIEKVGCPIVGTSANFHGTKPPKEYEDLDAYSLKAVDYALKGDCLQKQESTVVDTTTGPVTVLRQGAIKLNETDY
ncbi:MAG: L-threonylcarbamoyladenylate synthase [Patescibacteria group bacterium]